MTRQVTPCAQCGKPVTSKRRKFCSYLCSALYRAQGK